MIDRIRFVSADTSEGFSTFRNVHTCTSVNPSSNHIIKRSDFQPKNRIGTGVIFFKNSGLADKKSDFDRKFEIEKIFGNNVENCRQNIQNEILYY